MGNSANHYKLATQCQSYANNNNNSYYYYHFYYNYYYTLSHKKRYFAEIIYHTSAKL